MKVHDVKASVKYSTILKKNGKRTVNILQSISPHTDRPNRATPYRYGWVADSNKFREGERVTVWNKTNWQLTHLLEHGHFITNKTGGIGWARPRRHIEEAYNAVRPKFLKDMRSAEVDFEIK